MTYIITLLKVSENFNTIYLYSSLWLYFKHYELQALDSRKLKKKKKGIYTHSYRILSKPIYRFSISKNDKLAPKRPKFLQNVFFFSLTNPLLNLQKLFVHCFNLSETIRDKNKKTWFSESVLR